MPAAQLPHNVDKRLSKHPHRLDAVPQHEVCCRGLADLRINVWPLEEAGADAVCYGVEGLEARGEGDDGGAFGKGGKWGVLAVEEGEECAEGRAVLLLDLAAWRYRLQRKDLLFSTS